MALQTQIEWLDAIPLTGFKPSTIYIIKPVGGNAPQVFVTDKLGNNKYQINPGVDLSNFVKTINGLTVDGNANINLDLSFNNGLLSISGSGINVNLDARYVKDSDFQIYKSATDTRLSSLEMAILDGLKTPKPFDATAFSSGFPTQTTGFVYKVTVAGTVSGIPLQVGDAIIYDTTGNTPFILQTNVDKATTSIIGLVRIATQLEVDNGINTESVVVTSTLKNRLISWLTEIKASQTEVNAGTIDNKFVTPLKLEARISTALSSVHTHANKPVLDKFSEGPNGQPVYNGMSIYTLGAQEW